MLKKEWGCGRERSIGNVWVCVYWRVSISFASRLENKGWIGWLKTLLCVSLSWDLTPACYIFWARAWLVVCFRMSGVPLHWTYPASPKVIQAKDVQVFSVAWMRVKEERMLKWQLSCGLSNRLTEKAKETSTPAHWAWLISIELKSPKDHQEEWWLCLDQMNCRRKILSNGNHCRITKVSMRQNITGKHLQVWRVWSQFTNWGVEVKYSSITLHYQRVTA